MPELSRGDEAVVVAVEDLERGTRLDERPAPRRSWALTLKASRISSSESVSFIFLAIIVRNSISFVSQRAYSHTTGLIMLRTGKVNRSVVVGINLVDHVLKLRLGRVLAKRAHHRAQLLSSDLA